MKTLRIFATGHRYDDTPVAYLLHRTQETPGQGIGYHISGKPVSFPTITEARKYADSTGSVIINLPGWA